MDLFGAAINEYDTAIEIHTRGAKIEQIEEIPEEISIKILELQKQTGQKIREKLFLWITGIGISPNIIISWGIAGYTIWKILKEIIDFQDTKADLEYMGAKEFFRWIEIHAVPFIKQCVDEILYQSSIKNSSDEEVILAIVELKNFFSQHDWGEYFILTQKLCPYIESWLSEYENQK